MEPAAAPQRRWSRPAFFFQEHRRRCEAMENEQLETNDGSHEDPEMG